jgi:hypothetical protein
MVELLAVGRPPADARWRTVRVGVPETQQLKSEGKRLQRILANPHAPSAEARADDAFSMMS